MCKNDISASSYHEHFICFINNVDFSLEKCRFGARNGVWHYVLRRKNVIMLIFHWKSVGLGPKRVPCITF